MLGDIVTWEKVKSILNLDETQQELVEFLITSASIQADNIAGRILAARDVDITIDAHGGREYLLPSYPVNNIEMIKVNDNELQPNEYSVKKQDGRLRFKTHSPNGWDAISFKGNIGYNPVPEDLQRAVIETISANIRRFAGSGGNVGIKSLAAPGGVTSTNYEIDIPISARTVFLSYRGVTV